MSKQCSSCKETRVLSCFGKLKTSKDGLRYDCKICRKAYRDNNKELIKQSQQAYYLNNKEELLTKNKEYRINNIEKINEQRKKYRNRENIKEHVRLKNKEYLPIKKEKIKLRRKSDLDFRLSEVLRSKFHKFIKGKNTSLSKYIGCNIDFFKAWLESNFNENISWNNYGIYWDIDHVIPLSKFDFNNEVELQICYNWINLRPLEKKINILKSDKIDIEYINKHINNITIYKKNNTNYEYQSLTEMLDWLREKTQVW